MMRMLVYGWVLPKSRILLTRNTNLEALPIQNMKNVMEEVTQAVYQLAFHRVITIATHLLFIVSRQL
jgi:hypothetical protein